MSTSSGNYIKDSNVNLLFFLECIDVTDKIKFMSSNQIKHRIIVLNDYFYRFKSASSKVLYYRCKDFHHRTCQAKINYDYRNGKAVMMTEHNHSPNFCDFKAKMANGPGKINGKSYYEFTFQSKSEENSEEATTSESQLDDTLQDLNSSWSDDIFRNNNDTFEIKNEDSTLLERNDENLLYLTAIEESQDTPSIHETKPIEPDTSTSNSVFGIFRKFSFKW